VTATNSLPPQSRNGNIVVIAAELVGPFGTGSTWWTFPCRVWGSGGSTTIAGRNQLLLLLLLHVLGLSWLPTNWFKVGINDSIAWTENRTVGVRPRRRLPCGAVDRFCMPTRAEIENLGPDLQNMLRFIVRLS